MSRRAVCLNCIDGRVQIPVIEWIKEHYPVNYVDMITEPGIDGLLADLSQPIDHVIEKIGISIEKNSASIVVIAGHYDCKGNSVSDAIHKEQIVISTNRLKKEFSGKEVIGIWINDKWQCERL